MGDKRHQIGKWGEQTAASYLIEQGYRITGTNFRVPAGEIDLIAENEDEGESLLVFVEVKTRTSSRYGYPEESITAKKWKRLMLAIDEYLFQHPVGERDWRVDVIAIQKKTGMEPPEIEHFKNVIMSNEDYK